jgi:hypothetical protein
MALGGIALISLVVLVAWDVVPSLFPPRAHDLLGAFPLAAIAFAYLAHQAVLRPGRKDLVKAFLLAVAFLFWAANQLWPDMPQATLFNDLAIALFVLDVFLTMIGWPAASAESRRRTLLAEYEALLSRKPSGNVLDDLDAVRGDR